MADAPAEEETMTMLPRMRAAWPIGAAIVIGAVVYA
jgi:hypothetical protein